MNLSLVRSVSVLGLCVASAFGVSCTSTAPTEIVGGINTQIQVPEYIKTIGLVVQVAGTISYCETYPVVGGRAILPGTLGVLDGLQDELEAGIVTLHVLGLRVTSSPFITDCRDPSSPIPEPDTSDDSGNQFDRQTMVLRRRSLTFVDGKILFQNMPLKESCRDKNCAPNSTCVAGVCAPISVADSCPIPGVSCGEELPEYDDTLAFGTTNTCFDADVCMEGASIPAFLEDPVNCTFIADWPSDVLLPNADDLNVRITYDSFGTEILDRDPIDLPLIQQEGFSQPDPLNPLKFQLAPNLCESNFKTGRIVAVEASAVCPAKRALQPICESYVPPLLRDQEAGGLAGMCTLATLQPVESAVYVLMDQSDRMFSFYGDGPGSISSAIDLPLANPNAQQTQIALGLIPAPAAQCGTTNFAPIVPSGPVAQSRGPIGNVVANPATVLPNDPPQMSLQAALQGAYAGLGNAAPLDVNGAVRRRAVIVISNRDTSVGECAGQNSVQLAQAAVAAVNPISTYAVALGDGDPDAEDVTADQATLASAVALAQAGGTEVYNGVADALAGATAVAEILNELSTCQYAIDRIDLGANTAASLPDTTVLSYVNPLAASMSVVDIPRNINCTPTSGDAESGWNIEGDSVLICGDACTELRRITFNVTAFQYGRERVSPPVPIVASAPCDDATFDWLNL